MSHRGPPPIAATNSTTSISSSCDHINNAESMRTRGDVLDRDALGINASIDFDTIRSSGPPSRPLEFPAPTLGRAVTVAADIIDHRTGNIFLATSVLMRRPVHSKNCPTHGQAVRPRRRASLDLVNIRGHNGRIPKSGGRRTYSHRANARGGSTLTSCDPSCDLPDRAYCICKKLCNTAHGSVRL